MEKALIKNILEIARFYPSGDNCQPFRFEILDDNTLKINYVEKLARHALVYDNDLILLTLGSLLEYLSSAAKSKGYQFQTEYRLDSFDSKKSHSSLVTLKLESLHPKQVNQISESTLLNRCTDRRKYKPHTEIELTDNELKSRMDLMNAQLFINAPDIQLDFFAFCDSLVWTAKQLAVDIIKSVQFNSDKPKVGLPWRNLGVTYIETLPIRIVQKLPFSFKIFANLVQKGMYQTQKSLWQSSRSFIVYSYHKNLNSEQKTRAYKEMMHSILSCYQSGYHYQPSTISTEILNLYKKEPNIESSTGLSLNVKRKEQIKTIREQLKIPNTHKVAWVIRIGRPVGPFSDKSRTGRLLVTDLLT